MVTVSNNFFSGLTEVFRKYWNMYFKADSFLRNLSIVMSGTVLAQVIGFAAMPIVSRLFTVEDFGIFGTFQSILGVLSAGITLQYTQAVVLPKEKKDAINVFIVSSISSISLAILLLILSISFQNHLLSFINFTNILYIYLAVVASFVFGMNQTFQAWCIRVKAFKNTSLSQIISTVSSTMIWLAAGYFKFGAIGLVLGSILANLIASMNLARVFFSDLVNIRKEINKSKVLELAKKYRDFPLYAAPQNVMNALSQGLPVLLLGYFYGVEVAGFYAFGIKILQAPMNLVLNPLRQVLFQKTTEVYNNGGNLFKLYRKVTIGLIVVAFIPCVILFVWAPQIFSIVFGQDWFEAGNYARWLVIWLFIGFANVPSVLFARVLREQKKILLYECFILLTRIFVLFFSGMYLSPLSTIVNFSIVGFILNLFFIYSVSVLVYNVSKNRIC